MKAFIFGTFNPVTNAHVDMGRVAREELGPRTDIIYVPTKDEYISSWKHYGKGNIIPGDTRAKLLYQAVSPLGFAVSNVEIIGLTDGRTYNTIWYYGTMEDSILCLGLDNIVQMKKWYRWKDLVKTVGLLIYRRGDSQVLEKSPEVREVLDLSCRYKFADLDPHVENISSTKVREYYKEGNMEILKTLVPANVYQYLEVNKDVCT